MVDTKTLEEVLVSFTWLTPATLGIVAMIRSAFFEGDNRFVPLVSLIVAIALSLVFIGLSLIGAAAGIVIGLSAAGLYDFGKKTVLNK